MSKANEKLKEARVLRTFAIGEKIYKPNDIFVGDLLAAPDGALDADSAAVKYAKSLSEKS
jgi:hypothetical protein